MVKLGKDLTKAFGKKEILSPHLNNWFARGIFPDEIPVIIHPNKEKDDAFHPSSALKCARVLYAERRGEMPDREVALEAQKTFMYGHFIHGLVYYIVQDLGFTVEDDIEREVDFVNKTSDGNEYRVRGFIDVAKCIIPGQDAPLIIDVKSQMARMFAQLDSLSSLIEKYTAQVNLYLEFMDLDKGIILWAEKDTPHRFKETIIKRDPDLIDDIVTNWEYVVDCEARGEIPDCTCPDYDCPAKELYA